jgi:hypothetical protein
MFSGVWGGTALDNSRSLNPLLESIGKTSVSELK